MQIYIVAVIISLVLITILFFALRSTVKRIDYNTKKYFIDKLQDYDYLIDEKKKILNELNEEIEKNKAVLSEKAKDNKNNIKAEQFEYYEDLDIPKYMDENLFKKYKNIKNKFSFDKEKLIIGFIESVVTEKNYDYGILVTIRKKFTKSKIYEIMKLRKNDQKEHIYNFLSEEEFNVIQKYIDLENFKINNLITKLDTLIEKNDPTVYIYVGEKNKNYNYISPLIKTRYDENINEGIKINYKGVLYDYSL